MPVIKCVVVTFLSMLIGSINLQSSRAETIPVPIERPAHKNTTSNPAEPTPKSTTSQPDNQSERNSDNTCLSALNKLGHAISVTPPPPKDPECIVNNPVSIISINSETNKITLPVDMLNNCAFALEFTRWIADVANPLAKQHLDSRITKIHSGKGFTCRRRNNLPTGKLSEHAFGNAIDLLGFTLVNKNTFSVIDPSLLDQRSARFLSALRKTACGYFSTVLGPGTNAAHATHLHLDLGIHGKSGNYRICE